MDPDQASSSNPHGLNEQPGLEHVQESILNDAYPSAAPSLPIEIPARGVKRSRTSNTSSSTLATRQAIGVTAYPTSQNQQSLTFAGDHFPNDAYVYTEGLGGSSGMERHGSAVTGMGESELREEVLRLREQVRMFTEGDGNGEGGSGTNGNAGSREQGVDLVYDPQIQLPSSAANEAQARMISYPTVGRSTQQLDRDGDMQDAAQTLGQIATMALEQGGLDIPGHGHVLPNGEIATGLNGEDMVDPFLRGMPHIMEHHDQGGSYIGQHQDQNVRSQSQSLLHPSAYLPDYTERHHQIQDGGPSSQSTSPRASQLESMGLTLAHAANQHPDLPLPDPHSETGPHPDTGLHFALSMGLASTTSSPGTSSEYPFGLSIDALGAVVAPDDPPRKRRKTIRRSAFDIDENGRGPGPKMRAEVPVSIQTGKRLIMRERTDLLARAIRGLMRAEWDIREEDPLPGPEQGGPDWSKGPRHEENLAFQDRIARTLHAAILEGTADTNIPVAQHDLDVIKSAAHTSFLNLSKRYSYQVSDDAKKKQLKIAKRGRRWARKDLKQRKRARAAITMDNVPAFLLKIDYMSSEDSSEGENSGYPEGLWEEEAVATGRLNETEKVLEIKTPRWRSADLQTIYDRVDELAAHHVDNLKGKGHMAPPMRRFKMVELRYRRAPMDATEPWLYVDGIVPPIEERGKPVPAYKLPKEPRERTAKEPKEPRTPRVPKAPKAPRKRKVKTSQGGGTASSDLLMEPGDFPAFAPPRPVIQEITAEESPSMGLDPISAGYSDGGFDNQIGQADTSDAARALLTMDMQPDLYDEMLPVETP